MRFGYIWILLKDHLLSPGRRDGKGSENFNLNLPVPPPPRGSVVFWQPPPPFTGSQISTVTLLYTLSATTYSTPPSPLENHVIPPNPPTPTPLRRWWIVTGPLIGGELRVQGGGVEGIGEKFIFCHVSNFRYFQLKIKMPFVTLYVCHII